MEDPVVDPSAVDLGCDPQEGTGDSEIDPLLEVDAFPDAPEDLILEEAEAAPSGPAVLSDELRDQIVRQVEYYFSDENLPTDKFLLKFIKKDKKGYVPIAVIASFRRMKKLVQDLSLIEAALRTSSQLVVSEDGKKVRRLNPLPVVATTEAKSRTILVENLPDDRSEENMQRIFGKLGKIVKITLHDPRSVDKSASNWKSGATISSKVHALVEYETVDAAASAVSSLNDEKNWRSGMRVELLLKRMGKYGLVPKGRKATSVEKSNSAQVDEPTADREKSSLDNHEELPTTEEGEQGKGVRRNRYKSRGRGQVRQSDNGHGHGRNPPASAVDFPHKPVQGPRMPDGTRGFSFGRGKPAISDHKPDQHELF